MMHMCRCCKHIHGNSEEETWECYKAMPVELRKLCWEGMEIYRLSDEYDKEEKLKKWRPPE